MPKVPLFLEVPEFSYNTVWDRWKKASMPRNVSINFLVVMIQYRVVTDGQTDTRRQRIRRQHSVARKTDSGLASVSKFAVIFELPQTKIILFAIFDLGYNG